MKILFITLLCGILTSATYAFWQWSAFGACSRTCGLGLKTRRRGPIAERRSCKLRDCGCEWKEFGPCLNVTTDPDNAGGFTMARKRVRKGVANCVGKHFEFAACTTTDRMSSAFLGTILSSLSGKGRPGEKCTDDITDDKLKVGMFGRKCQKQPPGPPRPSAGSPSNDTTSIDMRSRDLLFILDESGSIQESNFLRLLKLAKSIVNLFPGASQVDDDTRIGVLAFASSPRDPFALTGDQLSGDIHFRKYTEVQFDGDVIGYKRGSTCLLRALKRARDDRNSKNKKHGKGNVIVLFTDGCANCDRTTDGLKNIAEELAKKYNSPIVTYLVSTADNSCTSTMNELSLGSHCYQEFVAPDWSLLDDITNFYTKMKDDNGMNYDDASFGIEC